MQMWSIFDEKRRVGVMAACTREGRAVVAAKAGAAEAGAIDAQPTPGAVRRAARPFAPRARPRRLATRNGAASNQPQANLR